MTELKTRSIDFQVKYLKQLNYNIIDRCIKILDHSTNNAIELEQVVLKHLAKWIEVENGRMFLSDWAESIIKDVTDERRIKILVYIDDNNTCTNCVISLEP